MANKICYHLLLQTTHYRIKILTVVDLEHLSPHHLFMGWERAGILQHYLFGGKINVIAAVCHWLLSSAFRPMKALQLERLYTIIDCNYNCYYVTKVEMQEIGK